MTIVTSYTTLLAAVQETVEDDSQEFLNSLPRFIDQAEERLLQELDLPRLEEEQVGTLTATSQYLTKPSGYKFADYFYIIIGNAKRVLRKRTEDFLHDYWPDPTVTDVPKYYSDAGDTSFLLSPTPDLGYSYELKFTVKPTKLSTSNETSYYTDNCSLILFYATMVEAVKFMKAWSQVALWEADYNRARDAWNLEMKRYRRDGGEVPNKPSSGPNSVIHTVNSAS